MNCFEHRAFILRGRVSRHLQAASFLEHVLSQSGHTGGADDCGTHGEDGTAKLRALVEHFADRPHLVADESASATAARPSDVVAGSEAAVRAAVAYVAGMTDRFAFRQAVALLDWDVAKLPAGVDG